MSAPLVLLHGWGLTPAVWQPLVERLPAELRIHAPVLPGHGRAAPAGARLADWSDALRDQLPAGAVVCGWSLGALVALDLARRHPDKVCRLMLIGATPRFVASADAEWPHGLDAATVAGFVTGFAADPAATLRRFVALQALGDANRRAVASGLGNALAVEDDTSGRASGLSILADTDLRDDVAAIRQPAWLLHGGHDALMPVAAARWLATRLPEARLTIFDDCGHAPFLSRPDDCAALVREVVLG